MSAADGSVGVTQKIVDHGANAERYNVVILGDGYRATDITQYHADVQAFVDGFRQTAPFGDLWCGINVHRIDVVSTDRGADDPATCGDGSAGTGAVARTYLDATFCGGNAVRRLLTCDAPRARAVAQSRVPATHVTLVIVNSPLYGGSGGDVATFSTAPGASEIAMHEMGHAGFGLADEYEYYAGCSSGEAGHDVYPGAEPIEPNVTCNTDRGSIKWKSVLTPVTHPLPTTTNANCAACDPQGNPQADDHVGAYEGARYMHCGCFRPSFNCRMRALGYPFCAACQRSIRDALAPYLPVAYQGLWWNAPAGSESGWGLNVAHQADTVFATWFTYDAGGRDWWLAMTAQLVSGGNRFAGTLYRTSGPPFSASPFAPAAVVATPVGSGTLTFADQDNGTFAYTVNGITGTKSITRQVFGALPTCRFGAQSRLEAATNYQDLWWNAPPGSESGWGLNITHQGSTLFVTWFTYDVDGAPLWLAATAQKTGSATFAGALYRTTGPAFSAMPWPAAQVTATQVGTVALTFADGNRATFAYTVGTVSQSKTITRQIFHAPGTVCS
ncbi:MAG: M64 family metallopeptidase [Betaproteobacteria bacterium]